MIFLLVLSCIAGGAGCVMTTARLSVGCKRLSLSILFSLVY